MSCFSFKRRTRRYHLAVALYLLALGDLVQPVAIRAEELSSRWPLFRNGVSQRVGDSTYFSSPSLEVTARPVGNSQYYSGYDRSTRSRLWGDSYQVGGTTYYNLKRHGDGGGFSGSSYKVGDTTYYQGTDRATGKRINGSSYRVGNTDYYRFRESGIGRTHSWSSHSHGDTTYYGR